MKKYFQILVLISMLPALTGLAREETMAARKKRLERKYLYKNTRIEDGTDVLPEAPQPENEKLEEAKAFEQLHTTSLEKQEDSPAPIIPPRRPLPRRKENRNWLLDTSDEDGGDMDAFKNPFSTKTDSSTKKKKSSWNWDTSTGTSTRQDGTRSFSLFGQGSSSAQRRENSRNRSTGFFSGGSILGNQGSTERSRSQGAFGSSSSRSANPYSMFPQGSSSRTERNSTLFPNSSSTQKKSNPMTGATPFSSPFKSPFSTGQSSDSKGNRTGYTPYKNPYANNSQSQRGRTPYSNMQEGDGIGMKKSPFEKWKDRTPTQPDPMRDDAFIDELMPKMPGH